MLERNVYKHKTMNVTSSSTFNKKKDKDYNKVCILFIVFLAVLK